MLVYQKPAVTADSCVSSRISDVAAAFSAAAASRKAEGVLSAFLSSGGILA